jgi:two-component system sensor histidine kinase KdpD
VAAALHDEALRMSALVSNLLDMARIQSGEVKFNLQWQPLEEVVGSALRASGSTLKGHMVRTRLPHDLPLLRYDAVLIERVLSNLLENAAKYTPPGSRIEISADAAWRVDQHHGARRRPRPAAGREEAIFEKFTRGERGIGQAGRRAGAGDLPRHRRSARRPHRRRPRCASPLGWRRLHHHAAAGHTAGHARGRTAP